MTNKPVNPVVRERDISPRDKDGHLIQWPGRIAYQHDDVRLIYVGTLDGRHEFLLERVERVNLGQISFAQAKQRAIDMATGGAS